MTALFKDEWLTENAFYGFDRNLSGSAISNMFEHIVPNYCSLMLEGILDDQCNLLGKDILSTVLSSIITISTK